MKICIKHCTTYNYCQPVSFGPHKIMIRPREGHDLHIDVSVTQADKSARINSPSAQSQHQQPPIPAIQQVEQMAQQASPPMDMVIQEPVIAVS